MYVRRVHITNVRSIAELTWELPADTDGAGWHVILGDNGAGKSSFLRSIALALVGPQEAAGLRQSWQEWLRVGSERARIEVGFSWERGVDGFVGQKFWPTLGTELAVAIEIAPKSIAGDEPGAALAGTAASASLNLAPPEIVAVEAVPDAKQDPRVADARRHLRGAGRGWFSSSYGPFRRFTGGDKDLEKLYETQPKLARHLSLFGESVALTEALGWLQSLRFKELEQLPEGALLGPIRAFVNQPGFLPHGVRLQDITSSGVVFADASGFTVPVQNLSDGYRSILSMTFELVRQMALTYGPEGLFSADHTAVAQPGVVIIDEVDAHLHPTWQRTIGVWFRKHFPRVQFIVSTHSPLICQAAEVGTVFRLPRPGADPAADRGEMIEGLARKRLLYGNVLDAYGTGVFGDGVTRSDSAQAKLERLAELNTQELMGSLSDDERQAQADLRAMLPTDASAIQAS
jgi:predicted ATPase